MQKIWMISFKPSSDSDVAEWSEQISESNEPLEGIGNTSNSKKHANIVLKIQKYFSHSYLEALSGVWPYRFCLWLSFEVKND